jgi:hypothetical protein
VTHDEAMKALEEYSDTREFYQDYGTNGSEYQILDMRGTRTYHVWCDEHQNEHSMTRGDSSQQQREGFNKILDLAIEYAPKELHKAIITGLKAS